VLISIFCNVGVLIFLDSLKQNTKYFVNFKLLISIGESSMKIRPLHDRVIVKRLEDERKTASGIVIPDSAAEKPDQGEILAIGKGKVGDDGKVRPLEVKVGDKVLFGKYAGQSVKVQGEELLVMREEDIMGVIEG
jgi:chaperonin GroES